TEDIEYTDLVVLGLGHSSEMLHQREIGLVLIMQLQLFDGTVFVEFNLCDSLGEAGRQGFDVLQREAVVLVVVRQFRVGHAIDAHKRLDWSNIDILAIFFKQLLDAGLDLWIFGKAGGVAFMGGKPGTFERLKYRRSGGRNL